MVTRGTTKQRRDFIAVGLIWAISTVLLEWWAIGSNFHPVGGATQADTIDAAFDLLVYLGIPVFTFVITTLAYSIIRFRAGADPAQDGPPTDTNSLFIRAWVLISAGLAVFVIFNPGLKGLAELDEAFDHVEMTIDVTAEQWNWTYSYVDAGITVESADELVLPANTTILFRVTSRDVIHSFWVPAFRSKIDAVPGKVTEIAVTTTTEGDFAQDDFYRVQCAELCGTGHARMRTHVTVMSADEFAQWLASAG